MSLVDIFVFSVHIYEHVDINGKKINPKFKSLTSNTLLN